MTTTREGQKEPLTFANAPTVVHDGVRYLDDAAARELGALIAVEDAELLERLARE